MSDLAVRVQARADRTRPQRMAAPLGTLGALAAVTLALHYRDPNASGSWGFCPSALLGVDCPGCGGLRAVHALTDLDLAAAASSNLLFVVLLPAIVLGLARWAWLSWRGRGDAGLSPAQAVLLARVFIPVMAVFVVLRNVPIPLGEWLAS